MSDNPEDYELFHYGVKGMKWGVIRARTVSVSKAAKKKIDDASPTVKKVAKTTAAAAVAASIAIGSAKVAKQGMISASEIPKIKASSIDTYLQNVYIKDQIQAELLINYADQVRRGDY